MSETLRSASNFASGPFFEGYTVEGFLGEGGMGVVYRARDLRTDEVVAIKMLNRVDPAGIYRLKREFRTLADIVHPNLVRLIELQCSGETWFFTMELVQGTTFLDFLGATRRSGIQPAVAGRSANDETVSSGDWPAEPSEFLNEALIRDAFAQLAGGVATLHEAGKLHCDIKPSNLLVDERGRVVVLDFGVSSGFDIDPLRTMEGEIFGTPDYMSPEQAAGKPLGPASDWYAVGVVLYEALTGALPFSGSKLGIIKRKQSEVPLPPSSVRPGIPADLESLCVDLLGIEPESRPRGDEILKRLGGRDAGSVSHPPSAPPSDGGAFVGRAAELDAIRQAAQDVLPNRPVVVFVQGDSGIGKSALVQRFLAETAGRSAFVVLRGRCYERESVPYKAFDPIIDELSRLLRRLKDRDVAELLPRDVRALSRIFPVLNRVRAVEAARGRTADGADPVEVRRRASLALKELFARLADSWKVVISIDDLQWGDVESARMLLDILEPPDAPSMLVILSARHGDHSQSPMLSELFEQDAVESFTGPLRSIRLSELPAEDATELARSLLGDGANESLVRSISAEARGNPYFVRELSHYARRHIDWNPELATETSATLRLEPMLRNRIEALPDHARDMLEVVAVAARPLGQSVLANLSLDQPADASLWLQLRDAHLVRMHGAPKAWSIECFHDSVREAIVGRLSGERVAECHRRLASALERGGTEDAEILLDHYCRAGELALARHHVFASAQAANEALAFSRAARLYRLALELIPSEKWRELKLQRRLADALANDGRLAEGSKVYEDAATRTDGLEAIELRRLAAQHYLTSGHPVEGLRVLERVLGDVGLSYPTTPHATISRLLWERAQLRIRGLDYREREASEVPPLELARVDVCFSAAVGLAMSDLARTAAFSAQHLRLALRAGERMRIARGLAFEMGIAPGAGEEGLRWASRALPVAERLSDRHGDAYHRGLFFLAQGHVAYLSGQWSAAVDWLARAERSLRDSQTPDVHWALLSGQVLATISAAVSGDLPAVERQLPRLSRQARQRGDLYSLALMVYPRVLLNLSQDRPDVAQRLLSESKRGVPNATFDLRDFTALHCALLIDRYTGESSAAWERLSKNWPAIERSKILVVNIARVTALAERGSAALAMTNGKDKKPFLKIAKACALKLERERLPFARALAGLLRAHVAYVAGDTAEALVKLTDASLKLESAGLPIHAQCARRNIGLLMGGTMGRVLTTEMDAALREKGVKDPARFANLMAPGFDPHLLAR